MDELERRVGPVLLTWDPEEALARMSFVEPGVGGREEAETLSRQLDEWAQGSPFRLLVDCSDIVDADAGWRSVFGQWFRDRRDRGTIAWFNANPRVRLLVMMFRKGTGVRGGAFATEEEARAWLDEVDAP